ncbi:hypothetical protein BC827DRAFT_574340 [Russula dissimulans]|nr:hypothetical protein BC827DRAFT_574340 [Russula dissimulans]
MAYPVDHTSLPSLHGDGFLARMFGQQDATLLIESLLKMNARDVRLVEKVPGWQNALMVQRPSSPDSRADTMANSRPTWPLDFIPSPTCRIIPQKIWTPPDQSDWCRNVEQANLCMPIFFVQNNGVIGLPLPRATMRDTMSTLRDADRTAPLGGGHFTKILIAWPGYDLWERQIHIRDLTRFRNEITSRRFARLVAGVVDRFLTHAAETPGYDLNWRVGEKGITRNDVIIVGAVQVSAAGWMPVMQIADFHPNHG